MPKVRVERAYSKKTKRRKANVLKRIIIKLRSKKSCFHTFIRASFSPSFKILVFLFFWFLQAVEFKHVEGKRRTYFSCLYALGQKKNKKSQKPRSVGLVFSHEQDVIFSTTSKINQIIIDVSAKFYALF